MATSRRMCTKISSGKEASGHRGGGMPSTSGGAGVMDMTEKLAMRSFMDCGSSAFDAAPFPVSASLAADAWAGLGGGFGKCLALYFTSTASSICEVVSTPWSLTCQTLRTTHPEGLPVQLQAVSQIAGRLLFDCPLIVL